MDFSAETSAFFTVSFKKPNSKFETSTEGGRSDVRPRPLYPADIFENGELFSVFDNIHVHK